MEWNILLPLYLSMAGLQYHAIRVLLIWLPLTTSVTFTSVTFIDRLPSLQSSAVVQATKQHFGHHGIPHTLLTDNGSQYTSDLFKEFAKTYKFNHITSSPYWSQSNGRAEAAVKSAKHILRTAKDVDLALLSVRNTPPAGHTFSPAQRLFGRVLCSNLPLPITTLEPRPFLMTKWYPTTYTANYNKNKLTINMQDIFFQTSHRVAMSMRSLPLIHSQRPGFLVRSQALPALDPTTSKPTPDKSDEIVFRCNWYLP